jgi:hypothetical protein
LASRIDGRFVTSTASARFKAFSNSARSLAAAATLVARVM